MSPPTNQESCAETPRGFAMPERVSVANAPSGAHTGRAHAILSASGSAMWIACPPSARLNEHEPESTSEYAEAGTLGHELVENELLYLLELRGHDEYQHVKFELETHRLFTQDLDDAVTVCVRKGWELIEQARAEWYGDALIQVEQLLDFTRWVPGGFGTADLVIITPEYIHTVDWKFGQGEWVEAASNSQLRLYAAGALDLFEPVFGPFKEVRATVVQPRVGNVDTEVITPDALLQWADEVVAPAAALAWVGGGEFNPGHKQCRWCKVRGKCRARADLRLAEAQAEFREPVLLTDDEIALLYPKLDEIIMWAQDVQDHAHKRVLQGGSILGLKAVEGRSNRVITEPQRAYAALVQAGIDPQAITVLRPDMPELLPLTNLERQHGAARVREILGDLIAKPPGKVIVVPASDKRIALDMATASPEEDFPDDTA
jgi:hypothetical protein